MAKWLAKEFDWDTGRYTGNYYDIAEAGIVAVFVDSYYGDDSTGDGSSSTPYKTLGAAITDLNSTGADGSRIFMNGIFSETLPAQTYWYEFIGCGGGLNGKTIWANNSILSQRPLLSKASARYSNIRTLNFDDSFVGVGVSNGRVDLLNCEIVNTRFSTTAFSSNTNAAVRAYFSKLINCKAYFGVAEFINLYGIQNVYYNFNFNQGSGDAHIRNYLIDSYTDFKFNGTFYYTNSGVRNISTGGQFIDPTQNDFNVRITSPLIGVGTIDEVTGIAANVGGVEVGLPYNGITPEFTTEGGATITDLTIDSTGRFTITAPATTGTLETALMDLGNIYPLENIDLFNVFDFLSGEITQGVFEDFVSPRMALTIKLKYGLTSAEVDDCPWLLIEYGKQPTFSGTGASRVGNADDTFDPDTFQTITCRYMKLFVTLQDNS